MRESHWRDDADLADAETLAVIARGVGIDPNPRLAAATSPGMRAAHEANTAEVRRRSYRGRRWLDRD